MWKFTFLVTVFTLLLPVQVTGGPPKDKKQDVADATVFEPKTIGHNHMDFEPEHYLHKRYSDTDSIYRKYRGSGQVSTCTAEYMKLPGHTMCMKDRPNIVRSGLRQGAARFIVNEHNRYRGIVEPPATDLPRVIWSRKLALVAQKWANQCVLAHDDVRTVPEFGQFVGQNVAAGHPNWRSALKAWYDEIEVFRYGQDPKVYIGEGYLRIVGHFTQMVTNGTVMVGCGQAVCSNTKHTRYYVCNYLAGQSQLSHPYTRGPRCSKCPNNCRNGVCDCGGKFCRNLGKMNLKTCECECTSLFRGETCSQIVCPPADQAHCRTQWKPSLCKKYVNVPVECPYMCGLCTEKDKAVFQTVPRGKEINVYGRDFVRTKQGCWFYGKRPSAAMCRTYGDKGADKQYGCVSSGGKFGCDDCHAFSNVASEYCPVMCGLCKGPCDGKTCLNNGSPNPQKNCDCICVKPYGGPLCDKVACPMSDHPNCKTAPAGACQRFYNVPQMCPYMCGVCKH